MFISTALLVLLVFDSNVTSADRCGDRLGANLDDVLDDRLDHGFDNGFADGIANTGPNRVAHIAKGGPFRRSIERASGGHGLEIAGGLVSLVDRLFGGRNVFVGRSGAQWALWLWVSTC